MQLVLIGPPGAPPRWLLLTTQHISAGEECLIDYHRARGCRKFSGQDALETPGLVPCLCLSRPSAAT